MSMRRVAALAAAMAAAGLSVLGSTAPGTVGNCEPRPVPVSGFTAFAAEHPDPDTTYAGTYQGIFASRDGGATWTAKSNGLTDQMVYDLAIERRSPSRLYAALHCGVFRSTNGGELWSAAGLAGENAAFTLVLDPRNPKTLYAGGDLGIFKSTDRGGRWTRLWRAPSVPEGAGSRVFALAPNPRRSATLYAGTGRGVLKSVNAGATWIEMNNGVFPKETPDEIDHRLIEGHIWAMAVNPLQPRIVYFASTYGVYKTTNAGRRWRKVSTGLPGRGKYKGGGFSLAIDPRNPRTLYAANTGLYKSTNAGRSWKPLRLPGRLSAGPIVEIDPQDPRIIYIRRDRRGFRTTNAGRTWRELPIPHG